MLLPLHHALGALRRAALRRAALEGAGWGAVGAAAALLAGAAVLGWWPAPGVRPAVWAIAGALTAAAPLWRVGRAWSRFRRDADAAAWFETNLPELRTDLRAALDLAARPAPADGVTDALRASLVARVVGEAPRLGAVARRIAPRRSLRPALRAAVALAAAGAVAFVVAPSRIRSGAAALVGATMGGAVGIDTAPVVASLDLWIAPPAYTALPEERVFGASGDLHVVAGSEIRLQARTLVAAGSASLVEESGADRTTRVDLDVVEARMLSGRTLVREPVTWHFEIVTPAGRRVRDALQRRVNVMPDAPPNVTLVVPEQDTLAVTPDQVIDLQLAATDDFGLTSVDVVWSFVGDDGAVARTPVAAGALGRSHEEHVPFDLAPLHLQPGDEVRLHVEGADNDAIAGAKVGRTRSVTLRVEPPDVRNREALRLKEALFEALLSQLAGELTTGLVTFSAVEGEALAAPPSDEASADAAARGASVAQRWPEVLQQFDGLLTAMTDDPLSVVGDLEMLRASRARLGDSVERRVAAQPPALGAGSGGGAGAAATTALFDAALEAIQQTERVVLLLEDLVARHKADNVQRAMAELAAARDRMRELLEEYRTTQDPAVRASLEREMRRLEQRLQDLLAELASQIDNLPTEHLNADALEAGEMGEQLAGMQSMAERLRAMLDAGDMDGALALLDEFEASLDALNRELEPLGDAQPETLSEFDREMAALMDELNVAESHQTEVAQQTQAWMDDLLAGRAEERADEVAQRADAVRDALREVSEQLGGAATDALRPEEQARVASASRALARLDALLAERDLVGAASQAERAAEELSDLQWSMQSSEALAPRGSDERQQSAALRPVARSGAAAAAQAAGDLRAMQEAAQPKPSGEQRAVLAQLAEEQGRAGERAGALRERVSQMGERFPLVEERLGESVQRAGEAMDGARQRLGGGEARPAMGQQQQALDELRSLREQMQQLTQQQRQREQSRGRMQQERVEVARDGEANRAAFRQQVVESMREGGLDEYEEQLRRYYEQLLR